MTITQAGLLTTMSEHKSDETYHEVKDRLVLTQVELSSGTLRGAYHELSDALDLLADHYIDTDTEQ